MEELLKQLQASAQNIDGVDMVTLAVATQAVQTASTIQTVDSLDKMLADIQQIYTSVNLQDTEE
jgi:hypothetical protein